MNPYTALGIATGLGFFVSCLFAALVMWCVIRWQNAAYERNARLMRRLGL